MYIHNHRNPHGISFFSVALALILTGATLVAVGIVRWCLFELGWPVNDTTSIMLGIGGLIVLALGYIQLELELMRVTKYR